VHECACGSVLRWQSSHASLAYAGVLVMFTLEPITRSSYASLAYAGVLVMFTLEPITRRQGKLQPLQLKVFTVPI